MDKALPLPTQIMIGLSDFFKEQWLVVVIGLIAAIVLLKFFTQTDFGQRFWDNFVLNIPVVGNVIQKIILARFASTLGSLLESGVGLIASMEIVKTIVNNIQVAEVVDEAIQPGWMALGQASVVLDREPA